MTMGIDYYDIILRPLIKLVERYKNLRDNNDEINFLKSAVTKSIIFWLQTEKKHPDKEKEILQKIALNQTWIKAKELDAILYKNIGTRLMRNNNKSINIKDLGIMKFPNINYFLSNAPYHEIIDTAIIRESKESDKEKDIKFERMKDITKQILIGSEIAVKLKDVEQYSKIAPELNKDKDIIKK